MIGGDNLDGRGKIDWVKKRHRLNAKELSNKLFINYRTYSGYERNEIESSDDVKVKLAEFYNISLDYIMGISDNPYPIRKGDEYIRIPKPLSEDGRNELKVVLSYLIEKDKKNK